MLTSICLSVLGLLLLAVGGEALVRGAVAIAQRLKISTLLVSTVIVGFGTSMPELTVSVQAGLNGSPDIALGNVVGSCICNILLILGLAAVISPVMTHGYAILRNVWAVSLASLLLVVVCFLPQGGFWIGLGFLFILAAYLTSSYHADKKAGIASAAEGKKFLGEVAQEHHVPVGMSVRAAVGFSVAGIAILVFGAKLLVTGAVDIARYAGVSEAVIGLTLVAVGTSLPELAAAISASLRRHSDVIIGNILGSNIFNILGILGTTMLVAPIPFTGQIADRDTLIMLAVTVLMIPVIMTGARVSRKEGIAFLMLYVFYTGYLFSGW